WTIPTGPFMPGTPTHTSTSINAIAGKAGNKKAGKASAGEVVFVANNGTGISGSTIAEPSGASSGNVVLVSANWSAAYSTDGGTTFTQLDPTTVFPNDAV